MLEKTINIAKNICYYFDGNIIGSVLLKDQIDPNLITDVDIAIDKDKYFNIQKYLNDNGFKETKVGYKLQGYKDTIGSKLFRKEEYLPIHLCFKTKDFYIMSVDSIWGKKMERYSKSDIEQIKSMLKLNKRKVNEII